MAEECQAELKELKGVLSSADKKKDLILKSIKDQERILQSYVEKAQSRTRDIHRAGKVVMAKEKDVKDIAKLIEEREVAREAVVQNARSKVSSHDDVLYYLSFIVNIYTFCYHTLHIRWSISAVTAAAVIVTAIVTAIVIIIVVVVVIVSITVQSASSDTACTASEVTVTITISMIAVG